MANELVAAPVGIERDADRRLYLGLRRRLWEYEPLRASRPQLDLQVANGAVRITGRVRTLAMKEIIGYLCEKLEGVRSVSNELISDTEVTRNVADALATDSVLGPLCLQVDARAGLVTLAGNVPEPELEARAVELARTATGVLDVISTVAVRRPERPPTVAVKEASPPATADRTRTQNAQQGGD